MKLFDDFEQCEICGKNHALSSFCHVVITEDEPAAEKRYFALCRECRERCRHDAKYEREVTKIVFRDKLGRRIKTQ